MALEIWALTTLEALKDELGISDASKDSDLERRIHLASDLIRSYCDRQFHYEADIQEKAKGYGTPFLLVSRTPLLSISEITFYGAEILLDETVSIHDSRAGIIYNRYAWAHSAPRMRAIEPEYLSGYEEYLYSIVYEGGYVTPSQATEELPRTLPYDLEEACLQIAVASYRSKGQNPNIKSESLMGAAYTYANGMIVPETAMRILMKYQKVAMA